MGPQGNNPFKYMNLTEARGALKEVLAKKRLAKINGDRGLKKKCLDDQGMIVQRIKILSDRYEPSPEQVAKREIKQEDRREHISKFGFAITSHALHRYRLRFDPTMTMDRLYQKLAETDVPFYAKVKRTGQCPIQGSMVAVVKDKLILTFKDVQE